MDLETFAALWRGIFIENAALFDGAPPLTPVESVGKEPISPETVSEKGFFPSLLTDDTIRLFYALTERMLSVNEEMNLTAITEPGAVILLHYLDSLTVAPFIPCGARVADVGTGAGFPALPLAIARPDLSILALDSTDKRVRYVKETAALLSLNNLSTLSARAEEAGHDPLYRERFDVVVSRAVAAFPPLAELSLPFLRTGGRFLAMKGKRGREEADEGKNTVKTLGGEIAEIRPFSLCRGENTEDRVFIVTAKTRSTSPLYPRTWAKILKKPL